MKQAQLDLSDDQLEYIIYELKQLAKEKPPSQSHTLTLAARGLENCLE